MLPRLKWCVRSREVNKDLCWQTLPNKFLAHFSATHEGFDRQHSIVDERGSSKQAGWFSQHPVYNAGIAGGEYVFSFSALLMLAPNRDVVFTAEGHRRYGEDRGR